MATPNYVYHFYDTVTDIYQSTLGLSGVNFGDAINGGGTFGGSLAIGDPLYQSGEVEWLKATEPNMNRSVWIELNDDIVWGGFLTGRNYDSSSQTLSLSGVTFDAYAKLRVFPKPVTFTNQDSLTIAKTMWGKLSDQPGEPEFQIDAGTSGVLTSQTDAQWFTAVSEYITNMTNRDTDGIEYYIDTYWDRSTHPKTPRRKFFVASQSLPLVETGQTLVLNPAGGNILSYSFNEDGTKFATDLWEVGSGTDSAQVYGYAADPSRIDNGYPAVTIVKSEGTSTDKNALNSMAKRDLTLNNNQAVTMDITAKPDPSFSVNALRPGRKVTVEITDARFPQGYKANFRVASYSVTPGDNGEDTVSLSLEQVYG